MSIHNGLLHELGLPIIGPWTWICQAHFARPVRLHFHPLQLPPSPLLVRHHREGGPNGVTVKNLWVDGSRFMGWRLKWLGWLWLAWRLKMRTSSGIQTSDRLSGSIYGAWHVSFFDWFLSRIKASLCLPCIFPINTRVFSSHFSIFSWNILSERNCYPCQTDSFILSYRTSTHSLCSLGLSIVDSKNW